MKYASQKTIAGLKALLDPIRRLELIEEKKPGTFRKGKTAFLHFHEDEEGLYADLKVDGAWRKVRLVTEQDRVLFLEMALIAGTKKTSK